MIASKTAARHTLVLVLILLCCPPCVAASKILSKGIEAYNAGHYQKAIGLFGQAQATEFSNPVLHYYLANALSRVNQKTDAIKEYRIALALQPDGQMGQYCTAALESLGALPGPGKNADKSGSKKEPTDTAENLNDAINAIHKETEEKISQEKQRIKAELARLRAEQPERGPGGPPNPFGGNFRSPAEELDQNKSQKISKLTAELEHKTFEIRAAANARISALKSASAGKNGVPSAYRVSDNASRVEAIYKEAEARITDQEKHVDLEIKRIQTEASQEMMMDSPWNRHAYRSEAQKKIDRLRSELERRKMEIQADAKARVDAVDPEYSSTANIKSPR
jgi:hypothetical protein